MKRALTQSLPKLTPICCANEGTPSQQYKCEHLYCVRLNRTFRLSRVNNDCLQVLPLRRKLRLSQGNDCKQAFPSVSNFTK
jgi:hypothetical protein